MLDALPFNRIKAFLKIGRLKRKHNSDDVGDNFLLCRSCDIMDFHQHRKCMWVLVF